jgi:PAS domain S-box-containing protein
MSSASPSTVSAAVSADADRLADNTRQVLWLSGAAVLALVLIAILALIVVSRELRMARASYVEVQQTRETLEQVQVVFSTVQDAETGERGYVITGKENFLEPYHAAESALERQLGHLDQQIVDPRSRQILAELAEVARLQLAFLHGVVERRRAEGEEAAADLIGQEIGKQHMDQLRAVVAQLTAREKSLLGNRLQQFNARSERTERMVQVALSAAIFLLLTAGALLLRHTHRRLAAERKAREALWLLRSTMDNVTQGIAVFNPAEQLVAWNARYVELRGLDPAQVRMNMPVRELLQLGGQLSIRTPEGVRDFRQTTRPLREPGTSFDEEVTRDDGTVLQVRGRQMSSGDYIVTFTDITALKLSELAYRDQATRLASIVDNVVDAIVTINESGSIESWSRGAQRLFGYEEEEILRRNVRVLMPDPHSSAHDGYIRHYIQTGERRIIGRRREVEALHKDGRRIPVELSISEMRLGSRRLFVGVVRDISARLEIEQLKSGFVSTVSHELRTPLTSISGSLGLLAGGVAGELPAKATRLIDIAKLNCERLVRLINDILDLEKAESGKLDFRLEAQRLQPVVQQAIDLNRAYAQTYGAVIELEPGSGDPLVFVDRDRLIQVLTNILSNAAKFSPRGGSVHVSIATDGDSVRVDVRDEGPGIAPEFQARIFQKFAQADSSDSRAKSGTGLGLSIAKTIIERLGGGIGFRTQPGAGSTFYVTLPMRHESAAFVHSGPAGKSGPAVLICEDDPDIAGILVEILRQDGMRADAVSSARAARAALDSGRFDLALIDLHLPDADGLEFIAELRVRESTRELPVIVVTARSRNATDPGQVSALQLADWLQKPIDPRRLLSSIHSALSPTNDGRARILHVEDDESLTQLVHELLSDEAQVVAAHSLAEAKRRVSDEQYDLVILDITLGDGSGLDILPLLRHSGRLAPPVILYSASEASRELSGLVQAALVKSRDSVEQLLASVRELAGRRGHAHE